jgi:catechol 2,3-dioxygenase-like lactoylglutathione lyase family enzyme
MLKDYDIHATLATSDANRAKRWYADNLGWQPEREFPGYLRYAVGPTKFAVYETPSAGTAENTVLAWIVENVPDEVRRLRDRGVRFEAYDFGDIKTVDGVMTDPDGHRTAWFKDADANIISIVDAGEPGITANTVGPMIASSDIDRTRAWYRQVGGYEPIFEVGGEVLGYRSGNSNFNVYLSQFAGTAKNTVAGYQVPDIRAEMADLRSRGVTFEEYDFGDVKMVDGLLEDPADGMLNAWFKDPDGNILGIQQGE